jgi:organic hydroperoxide reductase OsmC/OhrA
MPVAEKTEREGRRPAPFPHHYEVAVANEGHGWSVITAAPRKPIVGGAPPEFGGKEDWWSPEHLLLSAVSLCLTTTFQAFAAKDGLAFEGYKSLVKGILDRTRSGLAFTSIVAYVEVHVHALDVERAQKLLETAKQHCIVAHALQTPVDLRVAVNPE